MYPALFTNDTEVAELVKDLTPLLALCVVINNVQPVLSGKIKTFKLTDQSRESLLKEVEL
jgi:sulfur carrier protein ThiS